MDPRFGEMLDTAPDARAIYYELLARMTPAGAPQRSPRLGVRRETSRAQAFACGVRRPRPRPSNSNWYDCCTATPSPPGSPRTSTPGVTEIDEYAVALRVATVLEEMGIDYTLGGSLASSRWP
jgi:hypothetical protein